jgi:hypothetical protein
MVGEEGGGGWVESNSNDNKKALSSLQLHNFTICKICKTDNLRKNNIYAVIFLL